VTGAAARANIKWLLAADAREPWQAALDRAQRTREPIMAFVYVENQQLTVMMDGRTFGNLGVEKAVRDFLCVRVNALDARNRTFLDNYGVGRRDIEVNVTPIPDPTAPKPKDSQPEYEVAQGRNFAYPVTLFISPDGALEHMVYGFVIADDFVHILEQVKEVMRLREGLRGKPDDASALAQLGGVYVDLQRYAAGKEALEKALALDPEDKLKLGETAWLDLGLVYMAEGGEKAGEMIQRQIEAYPDSKLHCKAQFLLGGARLASVEPDRLAVEELRAQGKMKEAAQAQERLTAGRQKAEEAWSWFEGEAGKAPCADTEWSEYALGGLGELRAEMAYGVVADEVEGLVGEGKIEAAVERLRAFGTDREHGYEGTDRGCEALFHAGEILFRADKRAEALAQWKKLADPDPKANPCAQSPWRGKAMAEVAGEENWDAVTKETDRLVAEKKVEEAVQGLRAFASQYAGTERACEARFRIGEVLFKAGQREEARLEWRRLAYPDPHVNPCAETPWPERAAKAADEIEKAP
jgi:tetratricopeptide (TPR) repeat protein